MRALSLSIDMYSINVSSNKKKKYKTPRKYFRYFYCNIIYVSRRKISNKKAAKLVIIFVTTGRIV